MVDISDLNNKVHNQGASSRGKLSATEFNTLVDAVLECQTLLAYLTTPLTETEYAALERSGELEDRPYVVIEG